MAAFDTKEAVVGTEDRDSLAGDSGPDTLLGLGGNDSLYGGTGNDVLDGGTGDDSLVGGEGDDHYIVDSTGDAVVEEADEGTDTVRSSVTYTLDVNVENLLLMEGGAFKGTGNAGNNFLAGNGDNNELSGLGGNDMLYGAAGDDSLDGGAGNDALVGGQGDDHYIVDSAGDSVTENADEGTDTVHASVTYALSANIENLILMDSISAVNGTGNYGNNSLVGNINNNYLSGLGGDDTLFGGEGEDSQGSDDDSLDGGGGDDSLLGGKGNDWLLGGAGNDRLSGGDGADRFVFDLRGDNVTTAPTPASYFDKWLKSNGLSLNRLTTLDAFNSQYTAWLDYLVRTYKLGHDSDNSDSIRTDLPTGGSVLPGIEGLDASQIDSLFDTPSTLTFKGKSKSTVTYSNQFNAPPTLKLTSQDGQDVITDFVRGQDKLVLQVSGTFYRDPQSLVTIETGEFFGGDGSGLDTRIGLTTDASWSVVLGGVTGITASDIDWVFTP